MGVLGGGVVGRSLGDEGGVKGVTEEVVEGGGRPGEGKG